jgi:hypothetical protein
VDVLSEVEIEARLEEVELTLKMLEERKQSLLKALEAAKMAHRLENRFEFNPPIPKNSGAFKNFLIPKILEAHREKHKIEYRIVGSDDVASAVEFSACSDEHRREITRACKWVQKVLLEKTSLKGKD